MDYLCVNIFRKDGIQWEEQVCPSREVAEMQIFMQILISCTK